MNELQNKENGSVPIIKLERKLEEIPMERQNEFLDLCCKKLAYGGEISMEGFHLQSFCKSCLFSPNDTLNISPILNLKGITDAGVSKQILINNGLKITNFSVINSIYQIKAKK